MSILRTKLAIPSLRGRLVPRARLLERLSQGLRGSLSLLAAPAGFGKTTLVSAWVAERNLPVAWLSLEEADSEPKRFLAYLLAALQRAVPGLGAEIGALLESPQPPPTNALLTMLLNELAALPGQLVLVLDDYHTITSPEIDQLLSFLLDQHLPQLHIVMTTRADPMLPLARLRGRGQLNELRIADLRFTADEARNFLSETMGLELPTADMAILEERTEGWVAGLQLAALSIQGQSDVSEFIHSFAGDHRSIVDYLVDEVLRHQPAELRSFLLQSAILERLHGPLCDAVTGQSGSGQRLEALHRGNFFVLALDPIGQWYRYHQLFANVLQSQLQAEQPEQIAALHQRASLWFEGNGSLEDAIRHALAAHSYARAATLIEDAWPALRRNRAEVMLTHWLNLLPEYLIRTRPALSIIYAHVLLVSGNFHAVTALLDTAEQQLTPILANPEQAASEAHTRHLLGTIAIARAAQALSQGQLETTAQHAKAALGVITEDDQLTYGAASGFLGIAAWMRGDLEAAYQTFAASMVQLEKAGNLADALNGAIILSTIRLLQGRLQAAFQPYTRALELAAQSGNQQLRGTADMYVGLSELLYEQNQLAAANEYLQKSKALGEQASFGHNRYRWYIALARIRAAEGDNQAALQLLDEAERRYIPDVIPNTRPIAALKARIWIKQGDLEAAQVWADSQGLAREPGPLGEYAQLTFARLLLARAHSNADLSDLQAAQDLLASLLAAAEAERRIGSVLEILILQSLAYQSQGKRAVAHTALSRALTLAEPEGYLRLFTDEGQALAQLLQKLSPPNKQLQRYIQQLLQHMGEQTPSSPLPNPAIPLLEPLSERELAVLRLLRSELSGPEIARMLVISLNTLRTHTKHIYAKLAVSNRRAAIRRASELDLF